MTIKIEIQENSRGLIPSTWNWKVENNQGGVVRDTSHGWATSLRDAATEATNSAIQWLEASTPIREGERVVVVDRGRERPAKVVGFGTASVFVEFDDASSMGAYNRSSIRRKL